MKNKSRGSTSVTYPRRTNLRGSIQHVIDTENTLRDLAPGNQTLWVETGIDPVLGNQITRKFPNVVTAKVSHHVTPYLKFLTICRPIADYRLIFLFLHMRAAPDSAGMRFFRAGLRSMNKLRLSYGSRNFKKGGAVWRPRPE